MTASTPAASNNDLHVGPYDAVITIVNKTGCGLELGEHEPDFGDWKEVPKDVSNENPSAITFILRSDKAFKNGSQAVVHYTISDDSAEKFRISICCNSENENFIKIEGNTGPYVISPTMKKKGLLALHPLIDTITVAQRP